jgi:hypothetical protein
MSARGVEVLPLSAATREGVPDLLDAIERLLAQHPIAAPPRRAPLPSAKDRPHDDDPGDRGDDGDGGS